MKLLNNTRFAAFVLAVVCVAALFGGTRLSFSRRADEVRDMFRDGVLSSDGKSTRPSLASQVETSMDYALGMSTLAANYEGDEIQLWRLRLKSVREDHYYIWGDTDEMREFILGASSHYHAVIAAADGLYAAMQSADLTESDAERLQAYYNDVLGLREFMKTLTIEYNVAVAKIQGEVNAFPARIFNGDWKSKSLGWLFAYSADINWVGDYEFEAESQVWTY